MMRNEPVLETQQEQNTPKEQMFVYGPSKVLDPNRLIRYKRIEKKTPYGYAVRYVEEGTSDDEA